MQVFRRFQVPAAARGAVYAVGNFDGLHRGHRAVIGEAGRIARSLHAPHGVLTFEPHPRRFFRPDDPPFRLTPFALKMALLANWGVNQTVAVPFDAALAGTDAVDFVRGRLAADLGVKHLVVGHDFGFGRQRSGNVAMLQAMGAKLGFGVTVITPQSAADGELFSSRAIRSHLQAACPREAAERLGRWWCVEGVVQHGDKRGRGLGFPTANMLLGEALQPSLGIYAVRAGFQEEGRWRWFDGAASLGTRPQFEGEGVKLETFLFDFDGDLYGKTLRVAFVAYLRPELTFPSLEAFLAQMKEDCRVAQQAVAAAQATVPGLAADLDATAPAGLPA